jgi:hypothetical protein
MGKRHFVIDLAIYLCILIVVLIVAVVSIGKFYHFEYKGSYIHAKESLSMIGRSEQNYFKEHNQFACDIKMLDENKLYYSYTYYLCNIHKCPDEKRFSSLPQKYMTSFNSNYWNAFAVSNLDGDSFLDVWMIDSTGTISHLQDDYYDCGNGVILGLNIRYLPYSRKLIKYLGVGDCSGN